MTQILDLHLKMNSVTETLKVASVPRNPYLDFERDPTVLCFSALG